MSGVIQGGKKSRADEMGSNADETRYAVRGGASMAEVPPSNKAQKRAQIAAWEAEAARAVREGGPCPCGGPCIDWPVPGGAQ